MALALARNVPLAAALGLVSLSDYALDGIAATFSIKDASTACSSFVQGVAAYIRSVPKLFNDIARGARKLTVMISEDVTSGTATIHASWLRCKRNELIVSRF